MYIHMDEVARVVDETGMRAVLGYGMIEGLNEEPDVKLKSREVFVKNGTVLEREGLRPCMPRISAASCSREFLTRVKEMAERDGCRIHIHVLENDDELQLMKKSLWHVLQSIY